MRIRASARIRSQAGPNNGWPRSTVRISTPSTRLDGAAQDRRLDHLDAAAVGAEALVADDQRQRDRVDAEDQRPFLGDDVKQASMLSASIAASTAAWIEATAPEWPRAKAIRSWFASSTAPSRCAQVRNRAFFEGDHRRHRAREYARGG